MENQFAEILVEGEENPFLSGAKRRDILIRDAGHSSAVETTSQPAFRSASSAGRGKFSSARNLMWLSGERPVLPATAHWRS